MNNGKCRFRTAYDGERVRVVLDTGKQSMTKQSFKDECDINVIMAHYMKTGVLPMQGDPRVPQFLDCTSLDYQEAMFTVANAKSLFADLPASVRNRFENNPAELLKFLGQEANREEAERLGFVKAREAPPPPVAVRVISDESVENMAARSAPPLGSPGAERSAVPGASPPPGGANQATPGGRPGGRPSAT